MLVLFHKILMAIATLSTVTGVSAAVFFRRNHYWLKVHKSFNTIAVVAGFAGVLLAGMAVGQQKAQHLNGFHPLVGITTIGLAIISLFLGFYQLRPGQRSQSFRTLHRWLGRLTATLIITAILSGLIHAGII